ncbi:MAG: hypothetical protein AAGA03_10850, partial [Planctomycetota bacterium]
MPIEQIDGQIRRVLGRVRGHLRLQNALSGACIGLVLGSVIAMGLAIVRLWVPGIELWVPLALISSLASLGGIAGLLRPMPLATAAQRVDEYYVLKDRAITALQFSATDEDPVRRMQVADAAKHLSQVRPADCAPIKPPRRALWTTGAIILIATAIFVLGQPDISQADSSLRFTLASDQAIALEESMLADLEELLEENEDAEELEPLLERLEELVQEMKEEGVDEADLMATLTEMEQSITEAQAAMKMEITDTQL